jgi:hypothetical protein
VCFKPANPPKTTAQHADAPSKFGTRYAPLEREFFRAVVRAFCVEGVLWVRGGW